MVHLAHPTICCCAVGGDFPNGCFGVGYRRRTINGATRNTIPSSADSFCETSSRFGGVGAQVPRVRCATLGFVGSTASRWRWNVGCSSQGALRDGWALEFSAFDMGRVCQELCHSAGVGHEMADGMFSVHILLLRSPGDFPNGCYEVGCQRRKINGATRARWSRFVKPLRGLGDWGWVPRVRCATSGLWNVMPSA